MCGVFVACMILIPHAYAGHSYKSAAAESVSGADSLSAPVSKEGSATRLFVASGLSELIEQVPSSTAQAFETSLITDGLPARFQSVDIDSVRDAVHSSFSDDTFDRFLLKEMELSMTEQARQSMLSWYASPLGHRVKQAETKNTLLQDRKRFQAFQQQLLLTEVEPEREQIIYRLDETMQSSEAAVDMMTNMQMAFNISLSSFLPQDQRLSQNEIQRLANQNRSHLVSQYRSQTREVLLYTYQEFSNYELQQLNRTLASEAGQQFVRAINEGIKKGMFASSLDLGDALGALLPLEHRGSGI